MEASVFDGFDTALAETALWDLLDHYDPPSPSEPALLPRLTLLS